MNIIISYLDTMFSTYPHTPRLLEAKAELQGMMEDAYASLIAEGRSENEAIGQVIRDFGNLAEIAPELGIVAELAPPAGAPQPPAHTPAGPQPTTVPGASAAPAAAATPPDAPRHPPITFVEARGYAEARKRVRYRTAAGVALFIISPSALVFLPAATAEGLLPLTPGLATALGVLVLFACVAAGVLTLFSSQRELAPFSRITEGRFSPDPAVTQWANELAAAHESGRIRALQLSVLTWIFSPVPLILLTLTTASSPHAAVWALVGVLALLALVAGGILILIPGAWAQSTATQLGHTAFSYSGADTWETDEEHSIVGVIAAFYWPLLTAIYLAWSFIGNAWGTSWIIWPIGAVLFGAIAAGGGAWESYRRHRGGSRRP